MMEPKKMIRWAGLLALASTLVLSTRTDADAAFTTAVASYSQGAVGSGGTQSLGFDFKANSAITVTQLGVYAVTPTSITQGQVVYLYDVTTSSVVASAAETGPFSVGFNYVNIAPTNLNTTDTYAIFSVFSPSNAQYGVANTGTLTFSPDITNVPVQGNNTGYTPGSGIVPPTFGYSNILAVDFQFSPTSAAVPEPSSMALMGLGMAGVVLIRRKMVKRPA